jgi:hypothetical protein
VPAAFPSHQGLILPLWSRYPRALDGVALSVGAAIPDVVDLLAWPLHEGELGQWIGHSLVGVATLDLACGLALTRLVRRLVVPRVRALARLEFARTSLAVVIGAISHVFFDLISHGNFPLLLPWRADAKVFPPWWYHAWTSVPLLVYRTPYPLAPHTIVWALLTVLGAWLFVRTLRPSRRRG